MLSDPVAWLRSAEAPSYKSETVQQFHGASQTITPARFFARTDINPRVRPENMLRSKML
jgi:hypothetical protein